MKQIFFLILAAATCLMAACSQAPSEPESKTLTIPGSGACETVLNQLATQFNKTHPDTFVTIPRSTGSSGGVRSVAEGTHPMGRIGRDLKPSEQGQGLMIQPFAFDAVVFAVGEAVSETAFTPDRLADIFSGKIGNWKQVGGPDLPVRVVARQDDETSFEIIKKVLPQFRDLIVTESAKIAYHDYEMADLLNKYPGSIGFLTFGSLAEPGTRMRAVALDGIMPTAESLETGKYPLKTSLGFVFPESGLKGLPKKFSDFVFSEQGRVVIKSMGLFPIERKK